jgi:4-amino-4-deoxy-L-arabinose transferase-like glycosyltransferase
MRLFLGITLVVALTLGTFSAVRLARTDDSNRASRPSLDIDTSTYDELARRVLSERSWRAVPPSQPPGFIVLLAAVYKHFGSSYMAAKLTLCALFAATALLASAVAWTRLGPLEGVIAGALTIFSPLLTAYAATLQYEIPAAFLSMIVTALLALPPSRRHAWLKWVRAAAIGFACAAAALVREPLAVLCVVAVIAACAPHVAEKKYLEAFAVSGILVLTFSLPIAAWSRLQQANAGRYVLISNKSDVNLRIGNNPNANGTYHLLLESIAEPSGWAYIHTEPARSLRLAVRKTLYFWGVLRDPWTVPQPAAPLVSRAILNAVPYAWTVAFVRGGAMLALFTAGSILLCKRTSLWPIPLVVIAVLGVHIVYFGSHRFSIPVRGQIDIVAAAALAFIVRAAFNHRAVRLAAGMALAWGLVAQLLSSPGAYALEAEELEGIQAADAVDPLAANGYARVAAAGGARPIAFLSGEALPRGSFVVRVYARTSDCTQPAATALTLRVRRELAKVIAKDIVTVGDLCRVRGYSAIDSPGILRRDDILDVEVSTSGAAEVWTDRIDILFGYKTRREVPVGTTQSGK